MINSDLNRGRRYRLSAVEWMLRVAGPEGLTASQRDFAIALDKHAAFAKLTQSDAHVVTAAIAADLVDREGLAEALQRRLRALLSGEEGVTWEDSQAVYQTLAIAVQIAAINR